MDGFGWRFFEKFQDEPFLKTAPGAGQVEKLIAQFPSTTAAHLTTLHTGMPVGEHGIFEWIYYEPALDAIIAPLLFSFAGTSQRDTLKQAGQSRAGFSRTPPFTSSSRNRALTSHHLPAPRVHPVHFRM